MTATSRLDWIVKKQNTMKTRPVASRFQRQPDRVMASCSALDREGLWTP